MKTAILASLVAASSADLKEKTNLRRGLYYYSTPTSCIEGLDPIAKWINWAPQPYPIPDIEVGEITDGSTVCIPSDEDFNVEAVICNSTLEDTYSMYFEMFQKSGSGPYLFYRKRREEDAPYMLIGDDFKNGVNDKFALKPNPGKPFSEGKYLVCATPYDGEIKEDPFDPTLLELGECIEFTIEIPEIVQFNLFSTETDDDLGPLPSSFEVCNGTEFNIAAMLDDSACPDYDNVVDVFLTMERLSGGVFTRIRQRREDKKDYFIFGDNAASDPDVFDNPNKIFTSGRYAIEATKYAQGLKDDRSTFTKQLSAPFRQIFDVTCSSAPGCLCT